MAKREGKVAADAAKLKSTPGREGRPRIVFLHYSAPPIVGGVEFVISQQVRLFSEAGFSTLMIAGREAEETPEEFGPVAIVPDMDSENPAYLETVDALKQGDVPAAFRELKAAIETGLRRVLKPRDIVIAHNVMTTHFNLALTAAMHQLASAGELPALVVWCHDISRHVNPQRPEPQYHGWPWDLLRTRIPGAAYVAVSTSRQQTLASILGCPPELIRVIPNGVEPEQLLGLSDLGLDLVQAYGLLSADLVMLMPVRITRVKNIEFALRVVELLKRAALAVRLIVTGPPDPHAPDIPDYFDHLRALRGELSLQEEVRFVHEGTVRNPGPLTIDETVVAEQYRVADLILMPSLREGFGMPVLEAALVGRPVFATSIPVTQDLPDFAHLIGKEETPESVARRIIDWARSDATHRMRVAARQGFTWSGLFSQKILPVIESVDGQARDSAA